MEFTDWLSHTNIIFFCCHSLPKIYAATTMGYSSIKAMDAKLSGIEGISSGHFSLIQCVLYTTDRLESSPTFSYFFALFLLFSYFFLKYSYYSYFLNETKIKNVYVSLLQKKTCCYKI